MIWIAHVIIFIKRNYWLLYAMFFFVTSSLTACKAVRMVNETTSAVKYKLEMPNENARKIYLLEPTLQPEVRALYKKHLSISDDSFCDLVCKPSEFETHLSDQVSINRMMIDYHQQHGDQVFNDAGFRKLLEFAQIMNVFIPDSFRQIYIDIQRDAPLSFSGQIYYTFKLEFALPKLLFHYIKHSKFLFGVPKRLQVINLRGQCAEKDEQEVQNQCRALILKTKIH